MKLKIIMKDVDMNKNIENIYHASVRSFLYVMRNP